MSSKQNKKEQILKAATSLFSQFGLDKTTMDDIAQYLNMGKATLYYYFQNKLEIYKQVVKHETQNIKEEIEKAVQQAPTPQRKIIAYVVARIKYVHKIFKYYGKVRLKEPILRNFPVIDELREDFDQFEKKLIRDLLTKGVEQNVFKIEDVDLATRAFYSGVRGSEYQLAHDDSIENIQEDIETLMNMVFRGIEK
ncbi:MAG TPA: TetR/AcrR family transcriptional regulator [bacterium]|nr:TetR/AcrR family transcriptional regulator [bacterium]